MKQPSVAPELEQALNVVLEYSQRRTLGPLPALVAQALLLAAQRDLDAEPKPKPPLEAIATLGEYPMFDINSPAYRREASVAFAELEAFVKAVSK